MISVSDFSRMLACRAAGLLAVWWRAAGAKWGYTAVTLRPHCGHTAATLWSHCGYITSIVRKSVSRTYGVSPLATHLVGRMMAY